MFEKIAVGIKTFLRDEQLFTAIRGILNHLPGAQLIIVDDGYNTKEKFELYYITPLIEQGHKAFFVSFDSGFGKKSNIITSVLTRPYLLIGSDDFNFDSDAANGIKRMIEVLDEGKYDIVSGRVNNRPYEFNLLESEPGVFQEVSVEINGRDIVPCDVTVNFSLTRREIYSKIRWDDDVKIGGGEHGAFFIDAKRAGFKTCYLPGVNINEQPQKASEEYLKYRNRARNKARPCFERRGIKKYILGTGEVDFEKTF